MDFNSLISGHDAFKRTIDKTKLANYKSLEASQHPIAMLITCVDSRVMPEEILNIKPGQLFTLRNIASLVQKEGCDPSTESALKYAVCYLEIKHIIVMGHSNCGGINALTNGIDDKAINHWLKPWHEICKQWDPKDQCQNQEQAVIESIKNIRAMSFINTDIKLHGWRFDIPTATITAYNPKTNNFETLTEEK